MSDRTYVSADALQKMNEATDLIILARAIEESAAAHVDQGLYPREATEIAIDLLRKGYVVGVDSEAYPAAHMKHVGYSCDHSDRSTTHMGPKWSEKHRVWKLKKRPGVIVANRGLASWPDEPICPHAKPTFVIMDEGPKDE